MRRIDADALMEAMYHRAFETDGDTMWQSGCWVRYKAIEQTIKAQPTIERPTGKWERHYSRPNVYADLYWHCSACGFKTDEQYANRYYKYCPHCGAEMRGDPNE